MRHRVAGTISHRSAITRGLSGGDTGRHRVPRAVVRTVDRMARIDTVRYLTVPELIDRWPIGRTKVYGIIHAEDFPPALVLAYDRAGRPRSMGFRLDLIEAWEEAHLVRVSDLGWDEALLDRADGGRSGEHTDPAEATSQSVATSSRRAGRAELPPSRKQQPRRPGRAA